MYNTKTRTSKEFERETTKKIKEISLNSNIQISYFHLQTLSAKTQMFFFTVSEKTRNRE